MELKMLLLLLLLLLLELSPRIYIKLSFSIMKSFHIYFFFFSHIQGVITSRACLHLRHGSNSSALWLWNCSQRSMGSDHLDGWLVRVQLCSGTVCGWVLEHSEQLGVHYSVADRSFSRLPSRLSTAICTGTSVCGNSWHWLSSVSRNTSIQHAAAGWDTNALLSVYPPLRHHRTKLGTCHCPCQLSL